jgi:membrane protease YdiL (CAAX protease family)
MPDNEASEKDIDVFKWSRVVFVILMSAAIFFCTTIFFMRATSDIKDYVSDHRMMNYDAIVFILILIFISFFYVLSKWCHPHIKSILPEKIRNSKWTYLIPCIIFSILAIYCLSYIVLPRFVGNINSPEMEGLRGTVVIWLSSILVVNILLDHSPFEEPLTHGIEEGWRGLKSIYKKIIG